MVTFLYWLSKLNVEPNNLEGNGINLQSHWFSLLGIYHIPAASLFIEMNKDQHQTLYSRGLIILGPAPSLPLLGAGTVLLH